MEQKRFSYSKLFWGILFLLGAFALVFDKVGIMPKFPNFSVIGIIFTIFFLWMILEGFLHRSFFLIIFGLAFIYLQYDYFINMVLPWTNRLSTWTVLSTALLASIGFSIIFPNSHRHYGGRCRDFSGFKFSDCGKKVFTNVDGEILHFENNMGSSIKYVNTEELVCATFENSFGEMKVYFDNAIIKNGTADINVETSFGAVVLYVPSTWNVENHLHTSFASVKEEGVKQTQSCPTLRIYGDVSFGELRIVYI